MNEELGHALSGHLDSLGDDLDPESPLFPHMNLETAEFEMVRAMENSGIDPAIIHAFTETGMLISEENMHLFSQIDLDLWQSKIEEFRNPDALKAGYQPTFPIGTKAWYGPDDQKTTKIVASVILHPTAEPILERFVGSNVLDDAKVKQAIAELFEKYSVKKIIETDGNIGCAHEEGEDFPIGSDCPFCPFWKGLQGSNAPF